MEDNSQYCNYNSNTQLVQIPSSQTNSILKCFLNIKKHNHIGIILNAFNLILTLSSIIIYIYTLYYPNTIMKSNGFFYFNFGCRLFFILDYILDSTSNAIVDNRFKIFTEIVIEIVSTLPFFLSLSQVGMKSDLSNKYFVICSSLVCFRLFRILNFAKHIKSDVNRELYNIMCSIFCLLITSSILINVIENTQTIGRYWLFLQRDCFDIINCEGTNESFHSSFFFVLSTVATIGYYSTINSVAGRCIIICLILISVIEIPTQSSNLMIQLSSKSVYARTAYKRLENVEFILISGNISYGSIAVLLHEYFHPDHGEDERHALILMPHRPDNNIKSLLQEYQNKLFYFEGDPLKMHDLQRCQFKNANMIVLLCNKQTDDSSAEDSKTIIQAMAIKNFLSLENEEDSSNKIVQTIPMQKESMKSMMNSNEQERFYQQNKCKTLTSFKEEPIQKKEKENECLCTKGNESRMIIQLLRPESEHHFSLSISKNNTTDQILCIDELKLSLLAKSCLCRGIIALISNLIITNSSEELNGKKIGSSKWIKEYTEGKDYEIYKIPLEYLRGRTFSNCAQQIYNDKQTILLGLNIESKATKMNIVLLSPMEFILPIERDVSISGYILAKDQKDADNVVTWTKLQKKLSVINDQLITLTTKIKTNTHDDINEMNIINHSENDKEKEKDRYSTDALSYGKICHVTNEHISKACITLDSIEKLLIAKGHIIICGICQNLIDFVKPLRGKYLPKSELLTIVILSRETIEDKIWNTVSFFEQIYLIQGDPMKKSDLKRAGIKFAKRVVILAPSVVEISRFILSKSLKKVNHITIDDNALPTVSARKLTREEEDLLDSKTIFKYNMISKMKKDIFCVIELINPKNVSFLNNKMRRNNDEYRFIKAGLNIDSTAAFAAGEVYYSSIMDNVLSQAYYNPSLLAVLKKLIVGKDQATLKLSNLFRYKNVTEGNLYLMDMPLQNNLEEKGMNYSTIFKQMLKRNIIVIGVYKAGELTSNNERTVQAKIKTVYKQVNKNNSNQNGLSDSCFYYVVTAPKGSFEVSQRDKLFVLSHVFPSEEVINKRKLQKKKTDHLNIDSNDDFFFNSKNFSKKVEEKKEIKRKIDTEGEQQLQSFNDELISTKDLLAKLEEAIEQSQKESEMIINDCITKKIRKVIIENQL